jgi:hypothetical protein
MRDNHRSPDNSDSKPEAQPELDTSSPSPAPIRKRLKHQDREAENMKKLFATLADNTKIQLREQEEGHAKEISDVKRANRDTQNLLTTKMIPSQTVNDHRTTAHFNVMTKASDTLFDGTPENWPEFEHHLLTEAESPTIGWNHHLTHFQPNEEHEPFNFLERYFDLPDDMIQILNEDLAEAKQIDLVSINSKIYKLHCLKTKLKNCFTTDIALDIET